MYMRFRLIEDLESDLKAKKLVEEDTIAYVRNCLSEADFEEGNKLNGHSFTNTFETENTIYDCQFYIDTSSKTYSSYVTSEEDGTKQSTFQQKGPLSDAKEAVDKLLKYLQTI